MMRKIPCKRRITGLDDLHLCKLARFFLTSGIWIVPSCMFAVSFSNATICSQSSTDVTLIPRLLNVQRKSICLCKHQYKANVQHMASLILSKWHSFLMVSKLLYWTNSVLNTECIITSVSAGFNVTYASKLDSQITSLVL